MTAGISFYGYPLAHALGWTLLHFCWQGAMVAVALWCVLALMPARAAQARYAAACIALVLMVVLPVGTFWHLAESDIATRRLLATPVLSFDTTVVDASGDGPQVPIGVRVKQALEHSVPWVPAVWLAGVTLFLARLNFGLVVARKMRSAAMEPVPDALEEVFCGLRRRLGVERAVVLMHSALVQAPTVIGWLRPVVLVPVGCFMGLSQLQVEALLAHELAHIRRHDYLVSVFQSVVEALLFYHPAVWWVSRQVRRERECCCDELAVEATGDRLAYAKALSWLAEHRSAMPEIVLGANGGVLKMRIKRLLGYREEPAVSLPVAIALLLAAVACAGVYWGGVAQAEAKRKADAVAPVALIETTANSAKVKPMALPSLPSLVAQNGDAAPELQGIYKTWLDEDVRWIITGPEAQAFKNLANDDERGMFIRQLSDRRDALAGAAQSQGSSEIQGVIADQTGAVVVHARVTAINMDKSVSMTQETDAGGRYSFSALPSGAYLVAAAAPGFATMHQLKIEVGAGQQVTANVRLLVGSASQNVTVTASPSGGVADVQAGQVNAAGTSATGPIHVSASVMEGNLISQMPPVYPPIAKAAHVQGAVVLFANITKQGTVDKLEVVSGPPMLTTAAVDAVRQWVYKPYLLNGQPVDVDTTIVVNFTFGPPQSAITPQPPTPSTLNYSFGAPGQVAPKPDGPVRVSAGVMAGMLIFQAQPVYPPEAKAAHVQGSVILHAIITKQGTIDKLEVVSGAPMLTSAAVDAVKHWVYKPFLLNGEPVDVDTTITVNYTFGESAQQEPDSPNMAAPYVDQLSRREVRNNAQVAVGSPRPEGPDENGVVAKPISGDVKPPMLIHMVEPEYTEDARTAKVAGNVLLHLWVDEQGRPQHVQVARGVGHGLDEKAVEAVEQYSFKPAMESGQPVVVALNVQVNFQLF